MESSPELRVVAKYTIGVDDIDVEAATEMGILVCHGPTESNWGGVAEGTITAMLAMLKKVRERDQHLKDGGTWRDPKLQGVYVGSRADGYTGITLGLIGLGRIGSRIATLLRPWKMRILAADPYVPESKFAEHGVTRVDLSTLLRESDVVSLHVVLTRETRHLIGAAQLALMKHNAILINTSRGPCIQEPALIEALLKGQIGGAALDVFEEEPLALDSQLRNLGDRVLLSPHVVSNNVGSGLGPGIAWATGVGPDARCAARCPTTSTTRTSSRAGSAASAARACGKEPCDVGRVRVGRTVLRRFQRRRRLPLPTRPDPDRGRQHLVHPAHQQHQPDPLQQ